MARIKYYDEANGQWKYADMTGISQAAADNRYLQQSVANSRFVKKDGDTMTGDLSMNENAIAFGDCIVRYNSNTESLDFIFD